MKKTVLTFGLISGAILSVMMLATIPFMDRIGFDKGMYIGYTTMVLAFLLVFFGIRSYRENVGGGSISFGRAFAVGILITILESVCYDITWQIIYTWITPDFGEKYANYYLEKMRAAGESKQAIDNAVQDMEKFKIMYANPIIRIAMTLIEPVPVGVIMTLISSAILRKK